MLWRQLFCFIFAVQFAWGPYAFAEGGQEQDAYGCITGTSNPNRDREVAVLKAHRNAVLNMWVDGDDCATYRERLEQSITEGQFCAACNTSPTPKSAPPQQDSAAIVETLHPSTYTPETDSGAPASSSSGVGSLFDTKSLLFGLGGVLLGGFIGYEFGKNSVSQYQYPWWQTVNPAYSQVPYRAPMGFPGYPGGVPFPGAGGLPAAYPAPGMGGAFSPFGGSPFGGSPVGGSPVGGFGASPYGGYLPPSYSVGTPYPYNLGFNGGAGVGYYNNGWYNGGVYQPGISAPTYSPLQTPIYNAPVVLPYGH